MLDWLLAVDWFVLITDDDGGVEGGGGWDFATPNDPFEALESHDMASIVTVGGKCFDVDPVRPEAANFDFNNFGCDLAGCDAIDAHDVDFLEPNDDANAEKQWSSL